MGSYGLHNLDKLKKWGLELTMWNQPHVVLSDNVAMAKKRCRHVDGYMVS